MGKATFTQKQLSFRIRLADAVALNAAFDGGDPAINTNPAAAIATGTKFRVRFAIQETTGGSANNTYHPYFSLNAAAYAQVTTTSPIQVTDSAQFVDDEATTKLLNGTGTFVAGAGDDLDAVIPTAGNINPGANGNTEIEICLVIDAAQVADTDTIALRVRTSDGAVLNGGYDNTPTITVSEAAGADVFLAGAAAGGSTAAGVLGADIPLVATSDGASTAAGVLSADVGLAASADGSSSGLGNLTVTSGGDVLLAGTAAGSSTADGVLGRDVPLAATAAGSSSGVGAVSVDVALNGSASGVSTADGVLTGDVSLTGQATGASTGTGDLSILGSVPLAGTAAGSSSGSGTLTVDLALAGTAAGSSTATGNLTILGTVALAGTADGSSTGDANLTVDVALIGGAVGSSTGVAALTVTASAGPSGRRQYPGQPSVADRNLNTRKPKVTGRQGT